MRLRALPLVVAFLTGCSASSPAVHHGVTAGGPVAPVETSVPGSPLTVVADEDAAAAALGMSRALFDRSPVVVVGRIGDEAGILLGASAAVGLGVPLLLDGPDGLAADPLAAELRRLGVGTVLAVGAAAEPSDGSAATSAGDNGARVVGVPAAPRAVARVTGLRFGTAPPVPEGGAPAAVAALDPAAPAALRASEQSPATNRRHAVAGAVSGVSRSAPLDQTVVLATGGAESVAAIATARAAGAMVRLTGGGTDPRGSDDVVAALSDHRPAAVVALGSGFAAEDGLAWKIATAETGAQLPGGGQLLFPGRLLVALYGHPGTGSLGVLGEQGLDATIQRARAHAAAYAPLVDANVVPAFEIIATVASDAPGDDGNYSSESDPAALQPWVEAAAHAGIYVILDLQPGRSDFLTQAQRYRSLLELPNVGLALDPEWRLGPRQLPLTQTGSVSVDEVNRVISWLADVTREKSLPQKLLVLHQFRLEMIAGRAGVDTSRDELAIMVHADGQGPQNSKQTTWAALHQDPPAPLSWGWKNFYDEDGPMLTPAQTIAQVQPTPQLISYQ